MVWVGSSTAGGRGGISGTIASDCGTGASVASGAAMDGVGVSSNDRPLGISG